MSAIHEQAWVERERAVLDLLATIDLAKYLELKEVPVDVLTKLRANVGAPLPDEQVRDYFGDEVTPLDRRINQ